MNRRTKSLNGMVVVLLGTLMSWAALAESFTQDQIREVFLQLEFYDYGKDPTPTHIMAGIVQFVGDKPALRSFTERQMMALLGSEGASDAAKQFICRQLWIMGTDESLPVLEKMLWDPNTAEMACYALRTNPSREVDRALRRALEGVAEDETQVCIMNVLGDRGDTGSADCLRTRITSESLPVARAAAIALSKIGGDPAAETIRKARRAGSEERRAFLTEAYLGSAEHYVRNHQPAKAWAIYMDLLDKSESDLTRRAALVGALRSGDSRAVDLAAVAIEREAPDLQAVALANSAMLSGPDITKKLVAVFSAAAPFTQVRLIEALVQRNDPLVREAITMAVRSKDTSVRTAAFDALAEIGDASSAELLCLALSESETQTETDTILASLRGMEGEPVSQAILDAANDAPAPTKIQLIQVIANRGYEQAVPSLLEIGRDEEPAVAKAALRAVGILGSFQAMPSLLDVLVQREEEAVQTRALRSALAVIGKSEAHRDELARLVQGRLDAAGIPARCVLLQLLSALPDRMSLQRLQAATEDDDPSVRDAAVRALADYPDADALDPLLRICRDTGNSLHRNLAMRGCVRLLKSDPSSPERAAKAYEQLAAHATTPAAKRLILSGLAVVQHPAAREIVQGFMEDDAVKAEAALALETIAGSAAKLDFNDEATALHGKVGGAKLVDSPIGGKALSLDGRDARIELQRGGAWSVDDGDFTVALWVRPESLKQAGMLCVGGYGYRHGWLVDSHPDGSVRLETATTGSMNNGSVRTAGGVLAAGRWTHIAVTVSRGDAGARIFINGQVKAQGTVGGVDLTNPEAKVVIGGIENANQNNFHGEIDELYICRQILSAAGIQRLIEPGRKLVITRQSPARQSAREVQGREKPGDWEAVNGKTEVLFDGKSFAGWEGDIAKTWRIENGALTAGSLQERAPRNEFLATTHKYENFDLRLKFKITGRRSVNAGVQFRTERIPNHHEVRGYQADIGPGVDGHLYDESRRNRMLATPDAATLKQAREAVGEDGWNSYRIRAQGSRIQVWLNGTKTVDYMEKDPDIPRTGILALQIHGGMQAIIAYRDIQIVVLPAAPDSSSGAAP